MLFFFPRVVHVTANSCSFTWLKEKSAFCAPPQRSQITNTGSPWCDTYLLQTNKKKYRFFLAFPVLSFFFFYDAHAHNPFNAGCRVLLRNGNGTWSLGSSFTQVKWRPNCKLHWWHHLLRRLQMRLRRSRQDMRRAAPLCTIQIARAFPACIPHLLLLVL